jgi:hypothetical protein
VPCDRACDERKTQSRNWKEDEHLPHHSALNRLVEEEPRRRHCGGHHEKNTHALGPRRPAEKQPPDHDCRPADHRDGQPNEPGVWKNSRENRPAQPLHEDDDDAGPQAQWTDCRLLIAD